MAFDTGSRNPRQRRIAPSYTGGRPVQTPRAQAMRRVSRASVTGRPVFRAREEGSRAIYPVAAALNRLIAVPGPYQTQLNPLQESLFQHWAGHVNSLGGIQIPIHGKTDYDYRGFWKSGEAHTWRPGSHFPDTYKTPYDTTFSGQSKYATRGNPLVWRGNKLVDRQTGMVVAG